MDAIDKSDSVNSNSEKADSQVDKIYHNKDIRSFSSSN